MSYRFDLKKHLPIFLSFIVIMSWAIFAITSFVIGLTKTEAETTNSNLSSVMDGNAAEVRFAFNRYISSLKIAATAIEKNDDFNSPEVFTLLADIAKNEGYEQLAIDYPDGKTYTSDGHVFDMTQFGYLDRIKNGETFINDVTDAIADGTPLINVFVPLKDKNGNNIAALRCAITTKTLTAVFNETFVSVGGYYHLIDGNGRYIVANNSSIALLMNENYFEAIKNLDYEDGYSAEQIKKAFTDKKEGFVKYSYEGQHRYAYYAPAGINDWVIMTVIPKEMVDV